VSSAILYLAIVAIWAFMLVPRWLRRSHAAPGTETGADDSVESEQDLAGPEVGLDEPRRPVEFEEVEFEEEDEPDTAPIPPVTVPAPSDTEPAAPPAPPSSADEGGRGQEPGPEAAPPPLSRTKIVQARRRLLTTLVLLAVAAATCTALKLASGWVCVPPAVMLGMYLLLLREAALADAENARWRASQAQLTRQRARAHAARARAARALQHTAQIIDISERLGDQLYDQYADATVRAVGD